MLHGKFGLKLKLQIYTYLCANNKRKEIKKIKRSKNVVGKMGGGAKKGKGKMDYITLQYITIRHHDYFQIFFFTFTLYYTMRLNITTLYDFEQKNNGYCSGQAFQTEIHRGVPLYQSQTRDQHGLVSHHHPNHWAFELWLLRVCLF